MTEESLNNLLADVKSNKYPDFGYFLSDVFFGLYLNKDGVHLDLEFVVPTHIFKKIYNYIKYKHIYTVCNVASSETIGISKATYENFRSFIQKLSSHRIAEYNIKVYQLYNL